MNKQPWAINIKDENVKGAKEHLQKVSACRRRVFSTEEDKYLTELVTSKSCTNWFEIAKFLPGRSARQCRDRWVNYLSPENSFEPWTEAEDQLIVCKVNEIGTKWSAISKLIPGRSDNSVKNRWYSGLKAMCTRTIDGHYIYEPKLANERKNATKSDKNHSSCGFMKKVAGHLICEQPPMLCQPQFSQIPMSGLPMFPMMNMFGHVAPQAQPVFQYQYAIQNMLSAQKMMNTSFVPVARAECPTIVAPFSNPVKEEVNEKVPRLSDSNNSVAQKDDKKEEADEFDEDGNIWDRQIENQLNEMDQDPFTTPELFNEWF